MSLRTTAALLIAALSLSAQAQTLSDAFNQGAALGRSGNTAGRSQINGNTAQSSVPGYTTNPPQTSYFGSPGISAPAAAAANACTGPGNSGGSQAHDLCSLCKSVLARGAASGLARSIASSA